MPQWDCRSAFLELAAARLIEVQARGSIVNLKLRSEIAKRNGCDTEQLRRLNHQVEHFMTAAQQRFDDVESAQDGDWETARDSFNNACEDVAQSIRRAVARFS